MNKRLKYFLHVAFWAFMFLSPLTYARGTGMTIPQYVMNCMSPLMLMVVFYVNYFWLTPTYFVAGKHRYFLLINAVMVISLGIALHYWMEFSVDLFQSSSPQRYQPSAIDTFFFILRDIINLAIFATAATCIALAQRWYWADKARSKAEAARTDAELSNLRNQINPHFLLNTLNNIYALTAFDKEKAQEAIQELSKMLRHILYDYQQPAVPLQDEVEFIDNYVKLMKIRLPQTVKVDFDVNASKSDITIAPMLFISLVENAFKHGVSPTEPSFVHIAIEADEQNIICDIRNSNYPKAASDHSGHGIGLQQVQRRLELAYFEHYTWTKGVTADGKEYHSRIHIVDWKESNSKLKSENK
jgi:sensor histidine kinase YesM